MGVLRRLSPWPSQPLLGLEVVGHVAGRSSSLRLTISSDHCQALEKSWGLTAIPTKVLVVGFLLALKIQQAVPTPELAHAHGTHGFLVCLAVFHQEVADADTATWHPGQAWAPWTAWLP